VRDGDDLDLIFPASEVGALDPNDTELLVRVPGGVNERPPEVVDVLVRVLSEEGARLIQNLESGRLGDTPPNGMTTADWWWSIANQHSKVFIRRVEIPVRTL